MVACCEIVGQCFVLKNRSPHDQWIKHVKTTMVCQFNGLLLEMFLHYSKSVNGVNGFFYKYKRSAFLVMILFKPSYKSTPKKNYTRVQKTSSIVCQFKSTILEAII